LVRSFLLLAWQFIDLDAQVKRAEAVVIATHKVDAASRRLARIPGLDPIRACHQGQRLRTAETSRIHDRKRDQT
jgi:hypothetical protein